MTTTGRPGWASRIGTMLFSGVFMLAFGGGGVFFGLLPLLDTARQAWLVRGWTPVSAQVVDVQLQESRGSKGGTTYQVQARYAYQFDGRAHESTRIGLERRPGYDNIGSWHHRWHDLLSDARSREQPVGAWVDPRQPGNAVLERRVRWDLTLFQMPFAVLFTAVGVGAALIFMRALLGVSTVQPRRLSSAPAPAPAPAPVLSAAAAQPTGTWAELAVAARAPGQALPPLPPGVKGSLQDAAKTLRFVRLWPRAVALMLGLGLVLWLLSQATDGPTGLVSLMPVALFGTAWAALTVHLATLRWAWRVDAGVLDVDRGSWLRTRRRRLARPDLRQLSHQLVYSSRTNRGPLVEHRRLLAHPPGGPKVVLTPALTGAGSAQLLAWHLQWALDASARSAPGDDGDKLPR